MTVHHEHALIFILIRFNFYHHGQFRSTNGGSPGPPNPAVHLEQARIFISTIVINFYLSGQFGSASGGSLGAPNVTVHLKHANFFI
jgi:hypothetical protein